MRSGSEECFSSVFKVFLRCKEIFIALQLPPFPLPDLFRRVVLLLLELFMVLLLVLLPLEELRTALCSCYSSSQESYLHFSLRELIYLDFSSNQPQNSSFNPAISLWRDRISLFFYVRCYFVELNVSSFSFWNSSTFAWRCSIQSLLCSWYLR